jgi:hypothetical protein
MKNDNIIYIALIYLFLLPKRKVYLFSSTIIFLLYGFSTYSFYNKVDIPEDFSIIYYTPLTYFFLIPLYLVMLLFQKINNPHYSIKIRFNSYRRFFLFSLFQIVFSAIVFSVLIGLVGLCSIIFLQRTIHLYHFWDIAWHTLLLFFSLNNISLITVMIQKYIPSAVITIMITGIFLAEYIIFNSVFSNAIGLVYTVDNHLNDNYFAVFINIIILILLSIIFFWQITKKGDYR